MPLPDRLLAAALDALPDPVFVFEPVCDDAGLAIDMRYAFVNRAGLALYAMPAEAVIGRRQLELFPSADSLGILPAYLRVLATGEPEQVDVPTFDENGVVGAFVVSAVRVDGRVVVSAQDVTAQRRAEQQVRDSQRQYQLLAESATDIVLRADDDTRLEWVSPSVTRLLGWRPDELLGRRAAELVHPDDREVFEAAGQRVHTGQPATYDARFATRDGGHRWMSVRVGPVLDETGTVVGRIGGWRDIDAEVAARTALEESERRYRILAENASDVVLTTTLDGRLHWVSESVTGVSGWPPEDLIGRPIVDFVAPDDVPSILAMRGIATSGTPEGERGSVGGEVRLLRRDGRYGWFAWTARFSADIGDGVAGFIGGLVDVGARRRVEDQLAHRSTHDALTGLVNRGVLLPRADQSLAQRNGGRVAILILDLDRFRTINDSLGHSVGDRLLMAAAARVRAMVPPGAVVSRDGGDELAILLPEVRDERDALDLAEALVARFRRPLDVGSTELYATASIGVSVAAPGTGTTAEDLLREADTALFEAKRAGRDRVAVFTATMRSAAEGRLQLERALRQALEADEFTVWYQPEVDLGDGRLWGVEALVRWAPPGGAVRAAGEFIDVAEQTGLILDLGDTVLRQAVGQAAAWAGDPRMADCTVWVNLSPLQLCEPGLLADLDGLLARTGAPTHRLGVEITEQVLLQESAAVLANLQGLRERGLRIAIDDFGTGYGTLTYLHRYPIDVVKIDRTFTQEIASHERTRTLVGGLVALAERLGLRTVAEGVETDQQCRALRELGCDAVQGFRFSPAVPADRVPGIGEQVRGIVLGAAVRS